MFGGGRGQGGGTRQERGRDLQVALTLTLDDAFKGVEKDISIRRLETCNTCGGSGAKPGSKPKGCPRCKGTGTIRITQGFFSMTTVCDLCQGRGTIISDPCLTCNGAGRVNQQKTVRVRIPAGIDAGHRIRVSGEGEVGPNNGPRADLYIEIRLEDHERFIRDGDDLKTDVVLTFAQAALGTEVELPKLVEESGRMAIPAGTQSHTVFRVRGKGMPVLNESRRRGDLLVRAIVRTPKNLSDREKELLRELGKIEDSKPKDRSILESLKDGWAGFRRDLFGE
jgi:molecular chaperone DnaJ